MKIVNDNYLFAKIAKFVENKSELTENHIPELADIVGDEDKAKEIVEAAKASMGKSQNPLFFSIVNSYAAIIVFSFFRARFVSD